MDFLDDILSLLSDLLCWKDWSWKTVAFYLTCLVLLVLALVYFF